MTRALKQSLQKFRKADDVLEILGTLGAAIGGEKFVEVPNRPPFVYVQLRNNQNELIQAFNDKVSPVYGLPVIVVRQGNRYVIKERDSQRYSDWQSYSPFLPRHGDQHSFNGMGGGGDVVWVYGRQFMPMLVIPSGSKGGPNLIISEYIIKDPDGNWIYSGNTGTDSLLAYKPTDATSVMGLVAVNRTTGNPRIIINSGTHVPAGVTGTSALVPYFPVVDDTDLMPAIAFRLASGTVFIGWDNLIDVRQYYNEPLNGASANIYFLTSGSSGVGGYDLMTTALPTNTYSFYSAAISATGTMIADFITEPNVPNATFITDGIYHLHVHAQVIAGTKNARLRYITGKRTSGGVETTIRVSELSNVVSLTESEIDLEQFVPEQSLDSTDRIWVRIYGFQDGAGSTPTVQLKAEGDTFSRFEVPSVTSAGGGTASVDVQDEGVAQGSASTFNFVGAGVTASVAGGLATITIPGGGTSSGVYKNPGSVLFAGADGYPDEDNLRLFWDNTNHIFRVGPPSPSALLTSSTLNNQNVAVSQNTSATYAAVTYGTGTSGSPAPVFAGYRMRGTPSAPTVIADNDSLQLLVGAGYDGSNFINAARIRMSAWGDWSALGAIQGSKMEFEWIPSGTATRVIGASFRDQLFTVSGSMNIPANQTYNISGSPHTHNYQPAGTYITGSYALLDGRYQPTGTAACELIYDSELTTTGTFNIPNIPSTYKHLEVRVYLRTNRASTFESVSVRLNGDSGANYDYLIRQANSASAAGTDAFSQTVALMMYCAAANSTAGLYSTGVWFLNDYADTTGHKKMQGRSEDEEVASTTNYWFYDIACRWASTAAVNRMEIFPGSGNSFVAGSRVSLYGYR